MAAPLRVFISFRSVDLPWADWIARVLRAAGHEVRYQREFSRTQSFLRQIDEFLRWSDRLLVVLSAEYFDSPYTAVEWETGLLREMEERRGLLCTVRIEPFPISGLLRRYPYLDLFDFDLDAVAAARLTAHVSGEVAPIEANFPGAIKKRPVRVSVPHPRRAHFLGREVEMAALMAGFERGSRAVALKGMPGVGKTALAVEYCHRAGAGYDQLLWVEGDSMEADLARLSGEFFGDAAAADSSDRVEQMMEWFAAHESWLLVLDGIDNHEQIAAAEKILACGTGHVLVTSRVGVWERLATVVPVEPWSPVQGAEFLTQCTGGWVASGAEAEALVAELGGLPLALEQAAAFVSEMRLSCSEYLARLRSNPAGAREGCFVTACRMTFAAVSPLARQTLALLAWMAPEPLPRGALVAGMARWQVARQVNSIRLAADEDWPLALHRALSELDRHSVLALNERTVRLHPLVQAAFRDAGTDEKQRVQLTSALDLISDIVSGDGDLPAWAPHTAAVLGHARRLHVVSEITLSLAIQLGVHFLKLGASREAESHFRLGLDQLAALRGEDHADTSAATIYLGRCLLVAGRAAEAEPLFRRVLTQYAASAPRALEHAAAFSEMGSALRQMGRFTEAEKYYRDALALVTATPEAGALAQADQANNLGLFLREQGRFAEAEPLFRQAIARAEAAGAAGLDATATVAAAQTNLGVLLRLTGRLEEAEHTFREAMTVLEKSSDAGQPEIAVAWSGMALVLIERTRYAEAEGWLRKARECHERTFGPDHPETMHDACDLAWLFTRAGRVAEARDWFATARAESERVLPPRHWHHGHLLGRYGFFLGESGDRSGAAIAFSHALDLLTSTLGPEHFRTRWVRDQLSKIERA